MKRSQFALKTFREAPKDADSKNARFLERGGYINKLMAGVYSFLPLGLRVMRNLEDIIREEMDGIGGQELFLPVLGPKENWQKSGRYEDLDILYKMDTVDEKQIVLNPTHEEIIVPLVKSMISSYNDLPLYLYQIQDKFRNEKRAKSGLLRGREFMMKDLYSFHINESDLDDYYEKMSRVYAKIFSRAGIGEKTILTFASGGTFSKYSHEFQTLSENGEDTIYLCEKCNVAVNKEIIDEHNYCPNCKSADLIEKSAIEVGNIFKLRTKYSKPFELKVANQKGETKEVEMGCYGIGISRLMATIVEVTAGEGKIVWPEEVAPFKVQLISLGRNVEANELYETAYNDKQNILYDDRDDISAGEKFAEADLIGSPVRIIISDKSLSAGGAEVIDHQKGRTTIVPLDKVLVRID